MKPRTAAPTRPALGLPQLTRLAYPLEEARELLGLGRTQIFEEIREGRLSKIKAGKKTLIRTEAILAWLQGREDEQAPPSKGPSTSFAA